jgi:ABC-type oligopeptide transport system substrate-binding subunit
VAGMAFLAAGLAGVLAQPAGKPPREEEEEPARTRPKVTLRVDDDSTVTRPGSTPVNLLREADQARHEAVRFLFRRLALAKDVVHFPAGRSEEVAPLPDFFDPKEAPGETLNLEPVDGKPAYKVTRRQIARVEPYEALTVRLVDDFLKSANDFKDFKDPLPERDRLLEAEKALAEVVRFHESARLRGLRKGRIGWDDLDGQLRGKLLEVRLLHVDALARDQQWQQAQDLADQLVEIYPDQPRVRSALVRLRVRQIDLSLAGDRLEAYVEARRSLDELLRQVPQAAAEEPVKRLRDRLQGKAETLVKTIDKLPDPKRQDQLRTIENIWPELPGLQKYFEKGKGYRILNVGVRHLPERLSPATAFVDAERLALDLLFESLVRLVPDPVVGQRYEPLLAAGSPEQLLLGRQFELIRDARWYRDTGSGPAVNEPVLAADVARTVLAYQKWPARSAEWKDLLGDATVEGDQHGVRLSLQQGYVDPLALMTFRVLPARLVQQPDDLAFARRPVGSGPYQFAGLVDVPGRKPYVRFLLNPTYGKRAGKNEQAIREIRFYPIDDIRTDLVQLPLHVAYDLDADQLKQVQSPEAGIRNVRIVSLPDRSRLNPFPNRRVWFVAVNHRKRQLQDEHLRRAVGLAIDRESILDRSFRGQINQQPDRGVHRVLTGPYPAGSWASNASPLLDLDKPETARALAKQHAFKGASLTLKYPSDLHPGIAAACQQIQEQVRQHTDIQLVLRPIPWRQLREEVEQQHDFELAYWCWDHADDRYWLGPLFDPAGAGAGGPNVLGPINDARLAELFRAARDRRQFTQLQQLTHQIHQRINLKMHLIPLWQLDTHVVLRNDVLTTPEPGLLDPLRLFGQVEGWQVK